MYVVVVIWVGQPPTVRLGGTYAEARWELDRAIEFNDGTVYLNDNNHQLDIKRFLEGHLVEVK